MTDKELFDKLSLKKKSVFSVINDAQKKEMFSLCDDYIDFLNKCKTERECVKEMVSVAEKNGFVPLESKKKLKAGDKVYAVNRLKNVFMAVIGKDDIADGVHIAGAHIDSPRFDLKQNPLYEKDDMAFLKTHYYGGIKKYQWTTIPLAIHGVIINGKGKKFDISIGEADTDPVFCITDLLPHLAKDQMTKKMSEGIKAENMNVLVGGIPVGDDEIKEKVKFGILKILNKKYGMKEKDFQSAEIEVVPAFRAKSLGFDESFVAGYGQDDRVCAYTTFRGILDIKDPDKTSVAFFADKEEIGSMGNTGSQSSFMVMTIAKIAEKLTGTCSVTQLDTVITNSECVSSDVNAALDPNYADVSEKRNSSLAGYGVAMIKYTGARGKYDSSDASSEFVNKIAKIMDENDVVWQTGELGKVDQGGGGTIAQYEANRNMDVIDCGVPVLSMHSPYEVTSKGDVYMAYLAYLAFFRSR